MTKKILLILGILAIVGIAVFFILSSQPEPTGESRVGFSIRDYLPFGKSDNLETNGTTTSESDTGNTTNGGFPVTPETNQIVPRLRKISNEPIAGATIFNIGTTTVVRFVEKGAGNVFEAKSDSVAIGRLTNTTIPQIIRAFWLPNGSGFLAQTLVPESEIIETGFVKLKKNAATSTAEILTPFATTIAKLPTNIKEITVKPDSAKIFYYTAYKSSSWYTSNPDGTNAVLVASNPLIEWIPQWVSGNTVMMQTKGSSEAIGYSYFFDVSTKVIRKVGSAVLGLSAKPNGDGSLGIVSRGGTSLQLFSMNYKTVSSVPITFNTLAEKCVWLKDKNPSVYCAIPNQIPKGDYPDAWYKGLVSTEDFIKKIDVSNDISYNVADLSQLSGQKIDVTDISISPDNTHLIFRNKIDGYLWMLRITD